MSGKSGGSSAAPCSLKERAPLHVFTAPRSLAALALLALGACATASADRLSTVTVDGREYELRTRTIDGPGGQFETTSVRVRGGYALCKIDSPGDCAAAVRRGRESGVRDND